MNTEPRDIVLKDRDIEIFQYLNEQHFMVSGQINGIFWPDCNPRSGTTRERLNKLIDAGYLKVEEMSKKRLRLFLITEKGLQVLRERKLDHGFSELKDIQHDTVDHFLKLVNIRAIFRELGQTRWISERILRHQETKRRWFPDGILEISGLRIAIELENSFKSRERYLYKFNHYDRDKEFALVIYVVSWEKVMSWLVKLESAQDKISFVLYDDLIQKKGRAVLENMSSKIQLNTIVV